MYVVCPVLNKNPNKYALNLIILNLYTLFLLLYKLTTFYSLENILFALAINKALPW